MYTFLMKSVVFFTTRIVLLLPVSLHSATFYDIINNIGADNYDLRQKNFDNLFRDTANYLKLPLNAKESFVAKVKNFFQVPTFAPVVA